MQTIEYRPLQGSEILKLESNGNFCEDWGNVQISEHTDLDLVRNNCFAGKVCLGPLTRGRAIDGSLELPRGISNCTLADCTVGANCTLRNVRYLKGYRLGDNCLLSNVDEMVGDSSRIDDAWMEVMNECGGRRILPFPGMTIGDAYLWARFRDHQKLVDQLERYARLILSQKNGYGTVGDNAVVKNTKEIRNVCIRSSEESPSKIYDCMALTDGVIGFGCTLEFGIIAQRFLLGENVHLEYGLRLNDTVVGDNSTIARCEVGNSIIFPAHEQHHNNSFLIAALVMGQSNVAAGGTLGSNHNGRTADNELAAGRGFWPGLCVSIKHSSRFASYSLLAKADFPSELNITLPFALVNNNAAKNQLEVMPAYWWLYNMYALNRNISKFAKRDRRIYRAQHVEFDPFAPDTAEEMMVGRGLIQMWTAKAYQEQSLETQEGRTDGDALHKAVNKAERLVVQGYGMEHAHRKTVILKPAAGYKAYEEMLIFYAMRAIQAVYGESMPPAELNECERVQWWVNLGGQIVARPDADQLIEEIENGTLKSWDEINQRLDNLWASYPQQKAQHAYQVLCELSQVKQLDAQTWAYYQKRFADILRYVEEQKIATRKKDEDNEFRKMTYWNELEMSKVLE